MILNTLPNWLTFARIIALPVFIILALFPERPFGIAAAIVFSAAAITDILDGYMARKTGQVSEFGKLLDPIADKILIASAFVMLIHLQRAPAWIVALIISREFAVSGLRAYAGTRNLVIPATFTAKVKTTFQVLAVIGLLVNGPFMGLPFGKAGKFLLWVAFAATMWSGYEYFRDYFRESDVLKSKQGGA